MGVASQLMEQQGLGVSLYLNGAAGDNSPSAGMCDDKPIMRGSRRFADIVADTRRGIRTFTTFEVEANSFDYDFGLTQLNLTLERVANCTEGGFLEICTICHSRNLNCSLNLQLDDTWVETKAKFTGLRIKINGRNYGFVTIPGEAIQELGFQIKSDGLDLRFDEVHLFGYSNNHLGYFTTPREYIIGGYESILSFWGITTGEKIRSGARNALNLVKPT